MASHEDKPLPELPQRPSPTNLTIESRAHLQRFILRALDDQGSSTDHEQWADVLHNALQELGDSITRGGWLPGLRRARSLRSRRRHEERVQRLREREEKGREEGERERTKGKSKEGVGDSEQAAKLSSSERGSPRLDNSEDSRDVKLGQLRALVGGHLRPLVPKPSTKHLLLTVDAFGTADLRLDGSIDGRVAECTFMTNVFSINGPSGEDASEQVLYGLDEWDAHLNDSSNDSSVQVVGGAFHFGGVTHAEQHDALCRVLRLGLYVYLSLVLEQHLLSNSHIQLHFPRPATKPKLSLPLVPSFSLDRGPTQDEKQGQKREGAVAGGLWNFFSKKTETLLHRAASVGPSLVHRGSAELPLTRSQGEPRTSVDELGQQGGRISLDALGSDGVARERPFTATLRQLEGSKDLLTTSPGMAMPLPDVLVGIAGREKRDPLRKLSGDDKAALSSVLGWEGKDVLGRGMTGTAGFVRHQGLSVLFSTHVPTPLVAPQAAAPSGSVLSVPSTIAPIQITSCGTRRKCVTFRYYQRDGEADETLGEMVMNACARADELCDKPGCPFMRGDHDSRWIHAGIRVVATVGLPSSGAGDDDGIIMWEQCAICGRQTRRERMHDGTYLFSFAKYLELLIYSPVIYTIAPPLCEHTRLPARPWSAEDTPVPRSRFNVHRKFAYRSRVVTFSLSPVDDIFELRAPRLQIVRRRAPEKAAEKDAQPAAAGVPLVFTEDDRRSLRLEIRGWWQGLSEHIDELEANFVSDKGSTRTKTLPRLPSEDDAYNVSDEAGLATPKPSMSRLPSSASSASSAPTVTPTTHDAAASTSRPTLTAVTTSESVFSTRSSSSCELDSMSLLSSLRHAFQRAEQTLYTELSRTPTASLNDVRRSFVTAARGASKRLSAWEAKHSSQFPKGFKASGMPSLVEPEWWKAGCHAVPGGNVIVREDDWGSIIAFTLSSVDYQGELAGMSSPSPHPMSVPQPPPPTPLEPRPSYFTRGSSFRHLFLGNSAQLDPDQDNVVWQEPETYSAVISRKEHPRELTSLMPFREVLRHKPSSDASVTPTPSKLATSGSPNPKATKEVPPSARAKPAVELSMQAADGRLSGGPETADKILHDLEANSSMTDSWRHSGSNAPSSSSGFVETHIRRGKTASIISTESDVTTGADSSWSQDATPPPPPPKDGNDSLTNSLEIHSQPAVDFDVGAPSSITVTLTSTIASAMRYMLKLGEIPRALPSAPHHGLLSADSPAIDERPHIKYDWTIGKRLKFSCTVYYAKQFDALRRRCGIETVFLRSLAKSENWAADGGKSRSNFWKTSDDQFIIKTLVNAWNVADLQVLIEFGPSYFRYMDATAAKPSVLAKLLGFYTVEIRNLETGATQAKADLLVMENLFYNQKINKTFDLKGIQGRKVKASNSTSKTLFDGEWIEDQRRALTLVRPHSKIVFQEAIKADCDFLARSNIMDYSLLLGINDESKHIACGLVDTIGSYTFAKTLEYKAKQGLNAGKEVTVVPPHEYQERFVGAMDDYFLACPDKWSRPLDDTNVPHDCRQLPSVL